MIERYVAWIAAAGVAVLIASGCTSRTPQQASQGSEPAVARTERPGPAPSAQAAEPAAAAQPGETTAGVQAPAAQPVQAVRPADVTRYGPASPAEPAPAQASVPVGKRPEELGIEIDMIAIQYEQGVQWAGKKMHDDLGVFRALDPHQDLYIMVPREITSHLASHGVEVGKAYRWHGGSEFEPLCDVDLSLSNDDIARQFGAWKAKPIDLMIAAAETDEVAKLEPAFAAGMTPDSVDRGGRPILVVAAANGSAAVVKKLLERGAKIDKADVTGQTPLHAAALRGHPDLVELLLASGASLQAKDRFDHTALFFAAEGNSESCARVLIQHGADVRAKDGRGYTPLAYGRIILRGRMSEGLKKLLTPPGS